MASPIFSTCLLQSIKNPRSTPPIISDLGGGVARLRYRTKYVLPKVTKKCNMNLQFLKRLSGQELALGVGVKALAFALNHETPSIALVSSLEGCSS